MIRRHFLAGAFGLATLMAAQSTDAATIAYGYADTDQIVRVDLDAMSESTIKNTGLPPTGNGVAINDAGSRLFYRAPIDGNLYALDLGSLVQTQLVGAALPGMTSSASFYDDAYWYVADNTDSLYRVDILGNAITGVTHYPDFDGAPGGSYAFGDIAITSMGLLYGATTAGLFYSVDVSGGSPTGYTVIGNLGQTLQITMNGDGSGLLAHSFNSGLWWDLSFSGTLTAIEVSPGVQFQTTPLRDIASVAVVPEPASMAMATVGGLLLAAAGLRRRRPTVA